MTVKETTKEAEKTESLYLQKYTHSYLCMGEDTETYKLGCKNHFSIE